MNKRNEPWYVHAALIAVILVLTYLLIQVAIIEPTRVVKAEKYFTKESRLRMDNLRQAEILWEDRFNKYTDNLDSLIWFISNDSLVQRLKTEVDSLTGRSKNPFKPLSTGEFIPDSLYTAPKSHQPYIVKVDTSVSVDTVINRRGRIVSIDTTIVIGTRYVIKDPDGYGKIGDLYSDALKNTASWE